ncbi:hypothetical protein BGZ60DRAFT_430652 [Tricladium varicosporioides]|nr:hypothetical protein BGZ60DRAFT_430652 [Hymenoscyphus varicosporioides]
MLSVRGGWQGSRRLADRLDATDYILFLARRRTPSMQGESSDDWQRPILQLCLAKYDSTSGVSLHDVHKGAARSTITAASVHAQTATTGYPDSTFNRIMSEKLNRRLRP